MGKKKIMQQFSEIRAEIEIGGQILSNALETQRLR